jgi:hypothetical protein
MSLVTITLGNKSFQLAVSDESFDLLMVILALSLQEQIQDLSHRIAKIDSGSVPYEEEKFAETLTTIAGYLENLAKKIGK